MAGAAHYCWCCGWWAPLADGVHCAWCLHWFYSHDGRMPGPVKAGEHGPLAGQDR